MNTNGLPSRREGGTPTTHLIHSYCGLVLCLVKCNTLFSYNYDITQYEICILFLIILIINLFQLSLMVLEDSVFFQIWAQRKLLVAPAKPVHESVRRVMGGRITLLFFLRWEAINTRQILQNHYDIRNSYQSNLQACDTRVEPRFKHEIITILKLLACHVQIRP